MAPVEMLPLRMISRLRVSEFVRSRNQIEVHPAWDVSLPMTRPLCVTHDAKEQDGDDGAHKERRCRGKGYGTVDQLRPPGKGGKVGVDSFEIRGRINRDRLNLPGLTIWISLQSAKPKW